MASLEHDRADCCRHRCSTPGRCRSSSPRWPWRWRSSRASSAYDDSIRKYLPELPAYADAIKVSHLLHHTSGLRDYNTLLSIAGRRDEDAWDNRVVLQMTARQTQLNFKPGDEYLYSNTGYTLLATIVERATGTPFAAFADANIFKPLGMEVTHYHVDASRLVHHRALAYGGRDGRWTLDTPINERAGAGGLYTNIPDLLKWDENFYTGRVGGPGGLKMIQTPGKLNDGKTLAYAWGLQIGTYRGLPIVEHSGSLGGFRAHIMRMPSQHTSVALLCNAGSIVADHARAPRRRRRPRGQVHRAAAVDRAPRGVRRAAFRVRDCQTLVTGDVRIGVRRRLLQRRSGGGLHDLSQRRSSLHAEARDRRRAPIADAAGASAGPVPRAAA